jgi:hypothetical protein
MPSTRPAGVVTREDGGASLRPSEASADECRDPVTSLGSHAAERKPLDGVAADKGLKDKLQQAAENQRRRNEEVKPGAAEAAARCGGAPSPPALQSPPWPASLRHTAFRRARRLGWLVSR